MLILGGVLAWKGFNHSRFRVKGWNDQPPFIWEEVPIDEEASLIENSTTQNHVDVPGIIVKDS